MLRRLLCVPGCALLACLIAIPAGAQQAPAPNPALVAAVEATRVEQRAAIEHLSERPALIAERWQAAGNAWWARLGLLIQADAQRAAEAAQRAAAATQARSRPAQPRNAAPAAGTSHDPCAEPMSGLLPSYITQRESHNQCGAYNHGGCGGRGCLGWAQIDEGHFWADSPWGKGPGSCYGLTYNGCVSKLSNGGTNLGPWKCC